MASILAEYLKEAEIDAGSKGLCSELDETRGKKIVKDVSEELVGAMAESTGAADE
jgi:hypothetical protein